MLDRTEIIRLSGYILEEKVEIARRYLIPKTLAGHGLRTGQVVIPKPALIRLIDSYAREAGVRNLENLLKKIMRKAAMEFTKDPAKKIVVGRDQVESFLGKPVFTPDEYFGRTPGVVTGLAWTSLG